MLNNPFITSVKIFCFENLVYIIKLVLQKSVIKIHKLENNFYVDQTAIDNLSKLLSVKNNYCVKSGYTGANKKNGFCLCSSFFFIPTITDSGLFLVVLIFYVSFAIVAVFLIYKKLKEIYGNLQDFFLNRILPKIIIIMPVGVLFFLLLFNFSFVLTLWIFFLFIFV